MNVVSFTGDIFAAQQFGGISRYFVELARHLESGNWAIPCIDAPIYINRHLWEASASLRHRGKYFQHRFPGFRHVRSALSLVDRVRQRTSPNVWHATYYKFPGHVAKKTAKVATFYDFTHARFLEDKSHLELQRRAYKSSVRCIAISEATKSDMISLLGASPDQVDVVHLASNIKAPIEAGNRRRDYLLWVGARDWYKNFEAFMRSYSNSRAASDGMQVVCAGGPQFTPREVELFAELKISPSSVRQLNPNDEELAVLYHHARALVYVSQYEGFGIPPLEAMTCGCPVIASNVSSLPEVVGEAAITVNPLDQDEIRAAIDSLVYDDVYCDQLTHKGVLRADSFSWEKCAQQTAGCYLKALG